MGAIALCPDGTRTFALSTDLRISSHLHSIQDGVLIDFSDMKNFSYNAEQDSITIEPGALWGEVYDGLQALGVAPVGGRATSVLIYFGASLP